MRSSSTLRSILPALLLAAVTPFSQAAVQSRIATISTTSRVALPHTIPAQALTGTDLGTVQASRQLTSLMLVFNRTAAQEASLTQLLVDLQDPSSSRYHQWLTPEQYGAQFGLNAADLTKVSAWLTAQGFTITETGRGSNYIVFNGTVGQVQQSFGTTIHSLLADGETHISNLTDPVLPSAIANVVTNLSGLNDFKLKPRVRTRAVTPDATDASGVHPQYTASATSTHYIAPGDFYTIYNETPLLASTCGSNLCTGVGVGSGVGGGFSIAVVGQTDITLSDVTAFRTASGLCTTVSTACPNPVPTVRLYGSDPGTSSTDLPEAMLDVEWAGATAPNANIVYVNSTNVFNSLISAVNNNLAPIISISYGNCEYNLGQANINSLNQYFQQANTQGQTIVGPSGDSGATDCDSSAYPAVAGLAVDFPASSPYVTAAGGSMFSEGSGTYWGSSNNANGGSALSYIPESVWNETNSTNGLAAGGGGSSIYFSKPYWQTGTGVPNDFARDVPDIALNSAFGHDGTFYCVSGSCSSGFSTNRVVGGTSVAAPSFAGILALVEQKINSRIGNAGPVLYALAASPYNANVYHDITSGNNNSPCFAGTNNCPSGGSIGYSAGVGYDQATGWGSVNVTNLAAYWNQVTPISAGTTIGLNTSTTLLTLSNTTTAVCGITTGTLPLTISVTGNGTIAPTGTVQILVDNAPAPTPVTITLSGTAAITINFSTAGISSGFHTITAVYSGDVNYASSKSSVTNDIVSTTKPDFAFTPCISSTSAISGNAATAIVFTIAPVNGFTGTVTLTATGGSALNGSYAFTPATVNITSTASATTSLVLYAYYSTTSSNGALLRLKTAKQEPLHVPWYKAGSGAALACVFLLVLPRRRRWGVLLAMVLSVAVLTSTGCGAGSVSAGTGSGSGTTTKATPGGPYDIQVIATATVNGATVSHLVDVAFTVN